MQRDILLKTIKDYENEFKKFIGAGEFPTYELQTYEVSLAVADTRGYDAVACTFYEPQNRKHVLRVSTNLNLFNRVDFPKDIDTLKSAVGVLYNYFGLRSICEMYSTDYTEVINNRAFLKFIPTQEFVMLNRLMHGWLDKDKVDLSIEIYLNMIFPLIKQFRLA